MAQQSRSLRPPAAPLTFDQLKIVADPRRLAILRSLMSAPGSLTSLGYAMGEHPAWIRHHLLALEGAGLVQLDHTETSGGRTEKYYRAAAPVLVLQEMVLPETHGRPVALFMGSHDLALEAGLHEESESHPAGSHLIDLPVGSLDGLTALRQGLCHLAGCHLLDVDGGEYNLPYVRRFFPDREMTLLTLAEREQGLMLTPGNPYQVHSLDDLAGREIRFANRQRGSGTRLWLDRQLSILGIQTRSINGYKNEYHTHTAVALSIQEGHADCGIGLLAAARQHGLDFIPLFHERYDLVIPTESLSTPALQPLFDRLNSTAFKRVCAEIGGYDTRYTGNQVEIKFSTM